MNKNNIKILLQRLKNFASNNLTELTKLDINLNNEIDSFYLGLIIRQHTICNDLHLLFEYKQNNTLTSEFILFRCLVDDFIHLIYIINQKDIEESIIELDADAINKNYNKIKELAELNENQFNGNYPYYPTLELLEEIKEKLKISPLRQQHFKDKENFKFKSFKTTGNIIRSLNGENYSHQLIRAYFIWRKLSDFVHYSNFTYEEERNINPENILTHYNEFAEIISYSYFVIFNSLKHFVKNKSFTIIDKDNLENYYKDSQHT